VCCCRIRTTGFPRKLRNQIIHIWNDALGNGQTDSSYQKCALMEKTILMAEGRQCLPGNSTSSPHQCRNWLLTRTTDQAIDIIELTARIIAQIPGKQGKIAESPTHNVSRVDHALASLRDTTDMQSGVPHKLKQHAELKCSVGKRLF
jgi:hypothetical protein